ncbi:MAG: dihydrofolate reductase family protein, partial [Fibrobacterales bacterium]|nr:dihydrofolate reductase family protein [Fibrobacterales bacterium]
AREFAPDLPGRAERIVLKGGTLAECVSEALSELGRRGMHRVWVEPGPELALAMLENGLADRFFLLRSPEKAGSGLSAGPVLDWLRNAEIAKLGHLGRDFLTEFCPKPSGPPDKQGD